MEPLFWARFSLATPIFGSTHENEACLFKRTWILVRESAEVNGTSWLPHDVSQPSTYPHHNAVIEPITRSWSWTRDPQLQTNSSAMSRVRRTRPRRDGSRTQAFASFLLSAASFFLHSFSFNFSWMLTEASWPRCPYIDVLATLGAACDRCYIVFDLIRWSPGSWASTFISKHSYLCLCYWNTGL